MKDLVDTTEMYLRTIYELEEEGVVPLRARIAERLEQSGPTVSQTVARMERDGLVHVASDRSLKMTDAGRSTAIAVMRKHRLAERLLTDKIGLDILKVHAEACRWEHVMSVEVERRLVEVLEDFCSSPFGNPIPGLDELGVEDTERVSFGERAIDLPQGETLKCRVVQYNEILQVDVAQLKALIEAGITIGSEVEAVNAEGVVTLTLDGRSVTVDQDLGHAVRVKRLD
ncbi:metal-dependent transcriptional regulator [Corynebacterium pygosceleis]|uniref:Diphtheria toxin repressor n=1 Tax=Corynebacterium pygosceleis TaxID=2800406 RepID=A0A9Q4C613_9CORY|nr:metal-dependent transcriptional regulator [Corynebacterium pygosceleis]MCK7636883.1 metal-dependent regulator [Corynebacterium pygosceleis]MCK7674357.1 metal-dependent regulator [Corynebacterium pygosceleis]MCX7443892.1 metal-dependent regulator [Corynebacterium pygosceleis]MCX7467636.1 metal-dependent regulator [Corynebacterium pygosceleis]